MDEFEVGTVSGESQQWQQPLTLEMSEDRPACVEWQWPPDQVDTAELDKVLISDRPLRVQLWRDGRGGLNLRISASG